MSRVITFKKEGYDPFIDVIKAYAIICVLVGHTFPYLEQTGYSLWIGMQVPLFVLVQVFHVFKKENQSFNCKKILWRIFIPFFVLQIVLFIFIQLFSDKSFSALISKFAIGGENGPGSYFPWVYLQLAIILPLIRRWFTTGSKTRKAIACIALCEGFEILPSVTNMPDSIYRLLAIRYFFLIYLGWIWVKDGIVINTKTIILSLISMATIIYFEYFHTSTEPWFYDTGWKCHRWPCYFYVSHLLCYLIYLLYHKVSNNQLIMKSVKLLAKCSYEIFLLQMVILSIFPAMTFIEDKYLRFGIRTTIIFILCIYGGYLFNGIYSKLLKNMKF